MIEREFVDSNILLYAQIDDSSLKHKQATGLLAERIVNGNMFISAQVLNEFTVNAVRKGKKLSEVKEIVGHLLDSFTVFPLTANLTMNAFRISERYQFSFWDSLIVAASLETQCAILYTEDLQNGQIIDGVLEIKNPFAPRPRSDNSNRLHGFIIHEDGRFPQEAARTSE